MPAPEPIAAVLWDADGVLQEFPGFNELWTFLEAGEREALLRAAFGDMPDVLIGEVDMAARVERLVDDLGLSAHRDAIWASWTLFPRVEVAWDAVARLRAGGTGCVLATNQDSLREQYMRPSFGDLLDGLYFSSELGLAKPDPKFFAAIAADLGLPRHRLLLVDDNHDNVAGARAAGLAAEWWHHRESNESLTELLARHGLQTSSPIGDRIGAAGTQTRRASLRA